jgi:hypothetical protein
MTSPEQPDDGQLVFGSTPNGAVHTLREFGMNTRPQSQAPIIDGKDEAPVYEADKPVQADPRRYSPTMPAPGPGIRSQTINPDSFTGQQPAAPPSANLPVAATDNPPAVFTPQPSAKRHDTDIFAGLPGSSFKATMSYQTRRIVQGAITVGSAFMDSTVAGVVGDTVNKRVAQETSRNNNGGTDMSGELVVQGSGKPGLLSGFAERDQVYAGKLQEAATANKYAFLPTVERDAERIVREELPLSILNGPVGSTLIDIAKYEAKQVIGYADKQAKNLGLIEKRLETKMPNRADYRRQQAKLEVAESAGRQGVEEVLELEIDGAINGPVYNLSSKQQRSLAVARRGLGALGIEVHVDTLYDRFVVKGLDTAAKIAAAAKEDEISTYADPTLLALTVETDAVATPGGEVKDFVGTIFTKSSRGKRELVTFWPVTTQSAGRDEEITLAVEGQGIDPEAGEVVLRGLNRGAFLDYEDMGNGVKITRRARIAADLKQMVTDLSDKQNVGVKTQHVTATGYQLLQQDLTQGQIEGTSANDPDVLDADIVQN